MAHLYEVQSNHGTHHVAVDHHHEHISKADFERILFQEVLRLGGAVAAGLILHRYTYKGPR